MLAAMSVRIELIDDPDAGWAELAQLFLALHQYHRPLTGIELAAGWEAAQRTVLRAPPDGIVLVAREGAEAVGFLNGAVRQHPVFDERSFALDNAFVVERLRHAGVGRALLERAEAWCREQGIEIVRLNVMAANTAGVEAWRGPASDRRVTGW
ncbi:MAG: GNAT family N-acetyltransferase [Dehalococcoidia bacterium]|nr:GNAT family N-acetyltransferase [Dehalococcoidia bacterium]